MSDEAKAVFDATKEYELGMRVEAKGPVVVRWPSDQEWTARARGRKILQRRLGRGVTEMVQPEPSDVDLAFYDKIKLNGGTSLTKAEAALVGDTLAACAVTNVELEGDTATVTATVLTGQVKLRLAIPTAAQTVTFRRAAYRLLELPFNTQEIRMNPDAGARLFDECKGGSDDYTGGVIPGIHKDAAVRAVIEQLERNLGPMDNEANF